MVPLGIRERFEIHSILGEGGMGVVYRARQISLDRWVALKLLKSLDSRQVARFVREGKLLAGLVSPYLVRVFDAGVTDGVPFIVCELVEGITLRDAMKQVSRVGEALEHALAIARGLEVVHAHGIVHRDVKPENVFVTRDSGLKVADFGLARRTERGGTVTRAGMIMGTPAYMAPEQVRGAPADHPVDQYALGVILFELITRSLPFSGESPLAIAAARLHQLPPPLLKLVPGIDPAVSRLVERMLAMDPAARFEDMTAVLQALEDCLRNDRPAVDPDPRKTRSLQVDRGQAPRAILRNDPPTATRILAPPRKNPGPWLLLAAGALVVTGVTFFSIRGPPPTGTMEGVTRPATTLPSSPLPGETPEHVRLTRDMAGFMERYRAVYIPGVSQDTRVFEEAELLLRRLRDFSSSRGRDADPLELVLLSRRSESLLHFLKFKDLSEAPMRGILKSMHEIRQVLTFRDQEPGIPMHRRLLAPLGPRIAGWTKHDPLFQGSLARACWMASTALRDLAESGKRATARDFGRLEFLQMAVHADLGSWSSLDAPEKILGTRRTVAVEALHDLRRDASNILRCLESVEATPAEEAKIPAMMLRLLALSLHLPASPPEEELRLTSQITTLCKSKSRMPLDHAGTESELGPLALRALRHHQSRFGLTEDDLAKLTSAGSSREP